MDSGKRTILRAILWNVLGLATMCAVGVAATGSLSVGGGIAVANTAVGSVCYVIYERIWARVGWGRRA